MKYITIENTDLKVSQIGLGCMRIANLSYDEREALIKTALEQGINFFDHADIYGGGESEKGFSEAIGKCEDKREKVILQSKCGIRKGFYDLSKEHILASVDGILKRLNTDYLDILLLHRPDALVEPQEVAEAFNILLQSGKVRYLGVSNHNPMQMELLNKYLEQKIVIDQLQFSITNSTMIQAGLNVNVENREGINRDGSILDYTRLKGITVQPWSPFQYGMFSGTFIDNDKFENLNHCLEEISQKYEIDKNAAAIAWILRHPAKMQPIVGTTNHERLKNICEGAEITLSREDWYKIYQSAGFLLP